MTATADPRAVAAAVTDPELPQLTLDDLGVLGDVTVDEGTVVVAADADVHRAARRWT